MEKFAYDTSSPHALNLQLYEQSMNHISQRKIGLDVTQVTHCAGHVSANTSPHQLHSVCMLLIQLCALTTCTMLKSVKVLESFLTKISRKTFNREEQFMGSLLQCCNIFCSK